MGDPLDLGGGASSGVFSGMLSVGLGAATGNPMAIASGAIGLGMSLFGGMKSTEAAKAKAAAEQQISGLEIQQDEVRKRAMELSANRQQIEVLRNAQRARSLALSNSTSQGAQFGSGLSGGYGQIAGAANWNNTGIQQNLGFGEQMFQLNSMINQQKMSISGSASDAATGAGLSSMGKSLMGSFGPIKNLSETYLGGGSSGNASNSTGFAGMSGLY